MPRPLTGRVDPFRDKWRAHLGAEYLGLFDTADEGWIAVRIALERRTDSGPLTLRQWSKAWFKERDEAKAVDDMKAQLSIWRSRVEVAKFIDWPLKRIKPQHVQEWLADLGKRRSRYAINRKVGGKTVTEFRERSTPLSYEAVAKALSLLKLCLDAAIREGKLEIGKNPARVAKITRRKDRVATGEQRVIHLTTAEIDALFALDLPALDRAVFSLAIYGGLRRGEIWGLRWEHLALDAPKPVVRVRSSYNGPTKTADSVRDVPLIEPAHKALLAYRASLPVRPISGLVFPADGGGCHSRTYDCKWTDHRGYRHGPRGKQDKSTRVWDGWRTKAGIRPEVTFHALRHTCGCHLAQGTWVAKGWLQRRLTLLDIKEWLGHSAIEVTERHYADFAEDTLQDAVHGERSPAGKRNGKRNSKNDATSK